MLHDILVFAMGALSAVLVLTLVSMWMEARVKKLETKIRRLDIH